jgi:hypothetical protein
MVAVVDLKFGSEITAGERASLRASLDEALLHAGLGIVSETEIQYVERSSKELFACLLQDRCRAEVGHRLNAALLLSGTISRDESAWEAALALFDVEAGALGAQNQRVCPRCTVATLARPLSELVAELVRSDRQRARGTLVVHTHPSGVPVKIDDRPVGSSDLEVPVFAGLHKLALGAAFSTTVEVAAKQRKEVDFKMSDAHPPAPTEAQPPPKQEAEYPKAPPPPIAPRPPLWRLGLAAGGAGLGVLLVGIGGKYLYDDGRGLCDLQPPQQQCRNLASTQGLGIGLVVAGGALAVAGGAFFIHDLVVQRRAERIAFAPLIGPQVAGVSVGGAL